MMPRRVLLPLLCALACARLSGPEGPQPLAVAPRGAYRGEAVTLRISGTGYQARGVQHLGGGGAVTAEFTVRLGAVAVPAPRFRSDENGTDILEVELPPDLPAGTLDVTVVDPYGLSGTLPAAFTLSDRSPPQISVSVAAPARVETQAPFQVHAQLANAGGVDARVDSLQMGGVAAAAGAIVPAGGTLALDIPAVLSQRGTTELDLVATLTDTLTGSPLTPAAAAAKVTALSPPALIASLDPLPAAVDVGQDFAAALTVSNLGDVDAASVSPAVDADPAFESQQVAPQDVPAGETRTFRLPLHGASPARAQVRISAAGADALTGVPVGSSASSPAIDVQMPAQLRAVRLTAPAVVSVGQEFKAQLMVANDGQAAAVSVGDASPASALTTPVVLPPVESVSGGEQWSFLWTMRADRAGAAQVNAGVAGNDANSAEQVSTSTFTTVKIETAATLSAGLSAPARVSTGQAFTVTETLGNAGEAAVAQLDVPPPDCGPAARLRSAPAIPPSLSGSGTLTLAWGFLAASAGTLDCSASARGADANSGQALQASATATGTVQSAAALAATMPTSPAAVSRGQAFTVTANVVNDGQATARGVQPALATARVGGADFTVVSAPAAADIPGGSSATFTWSCTESGIGSGALHFTVSGTGTDANSGTTVQATSPEAVTAVEEPAALSLTLEAPRALSRGQTFQVTARVSNTGGAIARGVRTVQRQVTSSGGATASSTSAPAPLDVAPGATITFLFDYVENGTGSGSLSFSVTAGGSDANSGVNVSAGTTSAPVPVLVPASLGVMSCGLAPSTIDRGQTFTVTCTVTNTGEADAASVTAAVIKKATGGANAVSADAPATVRLAGGASATFSWTFTESGTAPGSIDFSASASGVDANSGATLSAQSAPSTVAVQAPAALSASLALPPTISKGDTFTATLTVNNTGQATALSVQPGLLALGGPAVVLSAPSGSVTLAGSGSTTFIWTLSASGPGTLQLATNVTGSDANNGAPLSASASASQAVQSQPEATAISSDPFGGDGTSFAYLFSYQGMLYAGPNKTGSGAIRMAPDGSGPTPINWKLEVDTTLLNAARNSAYQLPLLAPACHTIGSLGCAQNSTACGPDNEGGRAMFASGTVNGTEWYLVTGASPSGGSRYLYMTNGNFPLASGFDDLAFVQLAAGQGSSARMMTAAHFMQNQLYLGFYDTGGPSTASGASTPVLNVLRTMPALPGYQAGGGTDLVNLNGVNLPAVGALGSPANSGHTILMVDSLRDFNGSLYVANNGGIARSVGAPTTCASSGCANWANATPAPSSWSGLSSVTVDSTALGALEPWQRAVPGMVAFGGRLFAARNTTTGPQLWSCNPAGGADPLQCEPGDWTLVAPNTSGDARLTQLNQSGNSAITLLAATASHLYVGFNNPNGARIYRTALPNVSSAADFTGRQGCAAGPSSCPGLGGNGLGASLTRLFDGRAFTYGGTEWAYVSAGTGSAGPSVYRLAP
ncbi:MAG TPA: hypothetical protein VFE90_16945 [Myxococcales bacterium]|nr:hypothetical protein [Myxococcales bacterium]